MYSAKAIRILDSGKIRKNVIYVISTTSPAVKHGWPMQEYVAKEKYGITNLEIDETRAIDSETMEIISIK